MSQARRRSHEERQQYGWFSEGNVGICGKRGLSNGQSEGREEPRGALGKVVSTSGSEPGLVGLFLLCF